MLLRTTAAFLLAALLALPHPAAGEDSEELRRVLARQDTIDRFWEWQQELQREASVRSDRPALAREIRDAARDRRALARALAFERDLRRRVRRVERQGESVRPIEDALRAREQRREFESRQRSLQRSVTDQLDRPATSTRMRTRIRSPFARSRSSGRGFLSRR